MSETQNAPELTPIYDRLHAAGAYHPFTADTFTDWASEAGDIVQISRDGTVYEAPVHKQKIVWKGHPKVTMEATGAKEREAVEKMSNRKYASGGGGRSYARNATGKTWVFEANEQHLFYQINDPDEGILAQLSVTETDLETLFAKTGVNSLGQQETLYSRIVQNAGLISTEVTRATTAEGTLSSNITQQAGRIDQIVTSVGSNGQVTAASIILAISGDTSTATISADKIDINGIVTALEARTLGVGGLNVEGNADFLQTIYCEENILAEDDITSNTGFYLGNTLMNVVDASASGNVLTITKADGTTVTFSKATVLTPSWSSGGEYSVVATQNGVTVGREAITPSILISGSGQGYTATVNIATTDGSQWTTHGTTRTLYLEQTGTTVALKEQTAAIAPATYASLPITVPLDTLVAQANDTYLPGPNYMGFSSVVVNVQGGSGTDVKTRFGSSSGTYYIEAYENPSSPTPIAGSSKNYQLAMNTALTQIQIQDLNGTKLADTPVASLSMNVGTLENGSRTIAMLVNGQSTAYSYTCTDYLTGSYSVRLASVTYSSYSGSELPSSRTMNIGTSGRKNPSGASAEITAALSMVMNNGAWVTDPTSANYNKIPVYTNIDDDNIMMKWIDASSVYSRGQTDLINAGGALERNTNTGQTPVAVNRYVTTLKVNVPTNPVSEVRFATAEGGAYIIGAYDSGSTLLANKQYSMKAVADTSTNGAYVGLYDTSNNRITTAPRARIDINHGGWTSDHKMDVYGQVDSAILITKQIDASAIYQAGYDELTLITPDASFNHAGNYYNAVLKKGSTTQKTLPASSSSQKGMYIPLYDNYTFNSNVSNVTAPSGYVGFRSVTVNVSASAAYNVTYYGTGAVDAGSINTALSGWNPIRITATVPNSTQGKYRYIQFRVDGKNRSFYFS